MIPEETLALLRKFEGFRGMPYHDTGKKLTLGYGTLLPITPAEGELLLSSRAEPMAAAVDQSVTVPLTANQRAALVSFVYNVGIGAFKRSTLLRKLNAGSYGSVPHELAKWVRAGGTVVPGLVTRRKAEATLWNEPDPPPPADDTRQFDEGWNEN